MTQSGPDAPDYCKFPEGDVTQALPNPAVRQHPRVDPILEIGGSAQLGTIGASKGRYHLAEDSEGHALSGLIPNHGLLRRQGPEARRELLPPGDDGLALPKATRLRSRSFSMQRRPEVGGIGREGEADRGGMGLENEARPILRCDSRKTLQAQRLGVWPVMSIDALRYSVPPSLKPESAMTSKRMLLASMTIVAATFWAVISFAADRIPFDQKAFEAAQAAGKSILVDVSAPWCPTCRAQKPIIEKLSLLPEYKDLTIFDVDFDTQKPVLRDLKVQQQSTLIVFKGSKEMDRSVGSTDPSAISDLLKKAI